MKKYIALSIISILFLFAFFSCNNSVEEEPNTNETQSIDLDESHEFVEFELFGKIKKGMHRAKVTQILNNPGERDKYNGDIYVYRLKGNLAAFIDYGSECIETIKIEPLVDPAWYEHVVSEIERRGFYELTGSDIFGRTGIGIDAASSEAYQFYLSDGRVVIIFYEDFTFRATSAMVDRVWFEVN